MSEQKNNFKPESLPQDLVNVSTDEVKGIKKQLDSFKEEYKDYLEPVLANPETIDHRIKDFEIKLHRINEERAKKYNRKYNPPEIFYVDRMKTIQHGSKIEKKMQANEFYEFNKDSASFHTFGNFIVVFVNNFDDKDISTYHTLKKLRHEMSHAGSVRKMRSYDEYDEDEEKKSLENYRIGARIISKRKKNILGLAMDEGHIAIEDEIFDGKYSNYRNSDYFLMQIPLADELVPSGREKYNALQQIIKEENLISENEELNYYRTEPINDAGKKNSDQKYSSIVNNLYAGDPSFFIAGAEFIYGDNMFPFARKVEQTYGKGSFEKLMST